LDPIVYFKYFGRGRRGLAATDELVDLC